MTRRNRNSLARDSDSDNNANTTPRVTKRKRQEKQKEQDQNIDTERIIGNARMSEKEFPHLSENDEPDNSNIKPSLLKPHSGIKHSKGLNIQSKNLDPSKTHFLDCLAARFMATRTERSAKLMIEQVLQSIYSKEQLLNYEFVNDMAQSGTTSLNNWRYHFLKAVKDLASAYKNKTVSDSRDGIIIIPKVKKLTEMISDENIRSCFKRSFSCIDEGFLDMKPQNTYTVRTAMKNLIANAIIIWLKHDLKKDYMDKEDAYRAIYQLDSLTPYPDFVPMVKRDSFMTSRIKKGTEKNLIPQITFVYSDGHETTIST